MSTETTSIRKAHRLVHGEGATILCLHASTSSSKQWQPLAERMAARYRVVAADLYGYGQSPEWHGERPLTLDDEISLIADEIAAADEPVHLVGHSYGGAVAARVAVAYPDRVASLTLYEPVMFGLLRDDPNSRAAWEEIRAVERFVRTRTAAGRREAAAQHFVDYWSGAGAWTSIPEWRRAGLAAKMGKVTADFQAVCGMPGDLVPFREFPRPTLLLCGLRSPATARRVIQLLLAAMPETELVRIAELGHMGPVTHAGEVNARIEEFIDRVERRRSQRPQVA